MEVGLIGQNGLAALVPADQAWLLGTGHVRTHYLSTTGPDALDLPKKV